MCMGMEEKHKCLGTRSEQLLCCMWFIVHQLEGDVLASYSLHDYRKLNPVICLCN